MNTIQEKFEIGAIEARVQRGKNKGHLKSVSPPVNTLGSAVWQAFMFVHAPHKISIGHLLMMDREVKEVYEFAEKLFETKQN